MAKKIFSFLLTLVLVFGNFGVYATPGGETGKAGNKICRDIDFDTGTTVIQALRALGYSFNRNIIINGKVDGTLTLHMAGVTFDEALEAMSTAGGFSYVIKGSNIIVAPQEIIKQSRSFEIHNANIESVAKQLQVFVNDERDVKINKEAGMITVAGTSGTLDLIEKEIKKMDKAVHQIMIRAAIIELNNNKTKELGVNANWNKDGGFTKETSGSWTDGVFNLIKNSFKFKLSVKNTETIARGKVLARPSIATSDGVKATIMMGDTVPVFTSSQTDSSSDATMSVEYKDVGVKLEVTPRINDYAKGLVTLAVNPSVSVISSWIESGNNKAPQISQRSATTTVRIRSGETLLIGGLLKDEELKTLKRVPFLSKIPILGALFRNHTKEKKNTEIIIAITPVIIREDEDGAPIVSEQKTTAPLKKEIQIYESEETEKNNGVPMSGAIKEGKRRSAGHNLDYHVKTKGKLSSSTGDEVNSDKDFQGDGQIYQEEKHIAKKSIVRKIVRDDDETKAKQKQIKQIKKEKEKLAKKNEAVRKKAGKKKPKKGKRMKSGYMTNKVVNDETDNSPDISKFEIVADIPQPENFDRIARSAIGSEEDYAEARKQKSIGSSGE